MCIKPPAQTEHEIARRMEPHKPVTGAHEEIACDKCLESKKLIPPAEVVSSRRIQTVTDADIDGENRHLQFGPYAKTGHNAVAEWLPVESWSIDRSRRLVIWT